MSNICMISGGEYSAYTIFGILDIPEGRSLDMDCAEFWKLFRKTVVRRVAANWDRESEGASQSREEQRESKKRRRGAFNKSEKEAWAELVAKYPVGDDGYTSDISDVVHYRGAPVLLSYLKSVGYTEHDYKPVHTSSDYATAEELALEMLPPV